MKIKEIEQDLKYDGSSLIVNVKNIPVSTLREGRIVGIDQLTINIKDVRQYRRIIESLKEPKYSIIDHGTTYVVNGDYAEKVD